MKSRILLFFLLSVEILLSQSGVIPSIGDGTSGAPYQVASWQNLLWIAEDATRWDKHYIQTADIDFNTATPAINTWNSNTGWMPIGNATTKFTGNYNGQGHSISNVYMNRSSVSALTQGFFGEVSNATINNITVNGSFTFSGVRTIIVGILIGKSENSAVSNANVSGSLTPSLIGQSGGMMGNELFGYAGGVIGDMNGGTFSGNSASCTLSVNITNASGMMSEANIGQLAGRINSGTASNSHSAGSITITGDFSQYYDCQLRVGGGFGQIWGSGVSNCYSGCAITGSQDVGSYGGLIGTIYNSGSSVINCYATGYVQGHESGGFVGYVVEGSVSRCYATGNVRGSQAAGGFSPIVGWNGTVNNCYSRGTVTRISTATNGRFGGFVGWVEGCYVEKNFSTGSVVYEGTTNPTDKGFCGYINYVNTFQNLFWDTQTSGQATNASSASATGKLTSEMKTQSTFTAAGWDFVGESTNGTNDYWKMDAAINDGYPSLSWQVQPVVAPTQQPTNLIFSNSKSGENNNIILSYTASADAEKYLIVRKTGAEFPTFTPSDGTEYSIGAQGSDAVIYVGTATTASDNAVTLDIAYRYKIFAYNGSGASTKYLTSNPLSGMSQNAASNTTLPSGSGNSSAGFPGVGVTVTFPGGTAGTTIDASKTNSVPASNFAALPGVRGMKNLYFTITSSNATPGTYTLVLDFSSLPDMTEAKWNKFKIMKRADNSAPWIDVTAAPHNATIVSRNTDGIWGKFTVSGLTSFSEFGGGEESVTHTVTSNSNDITVDGSLRKLINTAEAGDVITFNTATWGGSRTITVADSAIYIYKDLTIRGIDGGIILDGNNASKVLLVGSSVEDPLEPVVRLEKLIITRGNDPADRVGGIDNYGDLTMVNCVVADNRDLGVSAGTGAVGGILSNGEVTLINCTVAGNTGAATDGGIGGIYATSSYLYNSIIYGNTGEYKSIAFTTVEEVHNSLFEETKAVLEDNITGNNVIFVVPPVGDVLFNSAPLFVTAAGSATHPYSIQQASPCADAGNNTYSFETTDIKGEGRKLLKSDYLTTGTIDMGAYEFNSNNPLPVELTSFTASVTANKVSLHWKTATEVANYGFDIERASATDLTWTVIGFVPGSGNANSPKEYSFTDEQPLTGKTLYRLKQIDTDGTIAYSDAIEVTVDALPTEYALYQNYPNPFNPSTTMRFDIPQQSRVSLIVYDALGQQVQELVNEDMAPGSYSVNFDGAGLSSGLYFTVLRAGSVTLTRKMMLVK